MRYTKIILWINLFCLGAVFAYTGEVDSCLERGKQEFAAQQYVQAKKTFTQCLTLDPHNEDTLLSLGGVSLQQEELEQARGYFLEALKEMKRTSPYLSYTYSMLGDIALKQKQNKAALAYYNRSLSFNEAYTNSLVGKGVVLEEEGDKKQAAQVYKTALSVEPLNVVARKHLIALEPVYFSDEEMLEALKQRYAVAPDKENLDEEDRTLFLNIHATEQRGGVAYLKDKYPKVPAEYIATLFEGTSFSREVLTLSGYETVQKRLGQDAINLFERTGISIKDIFELRDLKGNKLFTEQSTLINRIQRSVERPPNVFVTVGRCASYPSGFKQNQIFGRTVKSERIYRNFPPGAGNDQKANPLQGRSFAQGVGAVRFTCHKTYQAIFCCVGRKSQPAQIGSVVLCSQSSRQEKFRH